MQQCAFMTPQVEENAFSLAPPFSFFIPHQRKHPDGLHPSLGSSRRAISLTASAMSFAMPSTADDLMDGDNFSSAEAQGLQVDTFI